MLISEPESLFLTLLLPLQVITLFFVLLIEVGNVSHVLLMESVDGELQALREKSIGC